MNKTKILCLVLCVGIVSGCGNEPPQDDAATSSQTSSIQPSNNVAPQSNSPDFEGMFDTIVKGSLRNATEEQEEACFKVLEELTQFDESQNKAFVEFLKSKLEDPSPYVRMEAGFNIGLIRNDLGMGEANVDLIPIFVELLQNEDEWVRKFALNDVDPVVRGSGLGDELAPLVPVFISLLDEPSTTFQSISYLGEMGPMAGEAVPAIRKAMERDNDPTINQIGMESIGKIESQPN